MAKAKKASMGKIRGSVAETPSEVRLKAEEGWINMDVRFLITEKNFGSRHAVLGRTFFVPGASHDPHKHRHAEELMYMVRGRGEVVVGNKKAMLGPEEFCYVPPDTVHRFTNTSKTETCEMIWLYGGAPSLEKSGYEEVK